MALLNSSTGTGVATVLVSYTGPAYAITSAEVTMQLTYNFPSQVTFSSMRVYAGQGESGQIAVAADLMPGTPSATNGAGMLTAPPTEVDMTDSRMVQAVQDMLLGPTYFSVDVDTVENPSAPLIGQLRGTDSMTFQIPGFAGTGAASEIVLHTLRAASGSVVAGLIIFDVNYRLAAGTQTAGMDIDGTVVAPAAFADPSGSGNAYAIVTVGGTAGLASLNGIVANPAAHKIDLVAQSTFSAPLAAANAALPVVAAVIPVVEVKDLSTFAPGELVEIYGTNLAAVTTDLSAWPGGSLPSPLNGVSVNLGGHGARLLYVSPGQVDALLPFGAPLGMQMLTLTNAIGTSAPVSLNVAAAAPALYNFAFENSNFTIVSSSNPAHANDVLVFYATGMGQTTPPLITGQIVPAGPPYYNTAPVTVTIGGVNANVIYSIAAPPYVAGLYQIAVTVPSGLEAGSQAVVATLRRQPVEHRHHRDSIRVVTGASSRGNTDARCNAAQPNRRERRDDSPNSRRAKPSARHSGTNNHLPRRIRVRGPGRRSRVQARAAGRMREREYLRQRQRPRAARRTVNSRPITERRIVCFSCLLHF
jgi:uncharacterized protein (TIGR03437 family)